MPQRTKAKYGILLAGMVMLGSLLAVVALGQGGGEVMSGDPVRALAGEPGAADGSLRTVAVYTDGSDAPPSERDSLLVGGLLEEGAMPKGEMAGTVLTDEDCAPDSRGVSHCLNRIALEDGGELAVRHSHVMQEVPCLYPGEEVYVRPA